MITRQMMAGMLVTALLLGGLVTPVIAQGPGADWTPVLVEETGICEGGVICGPSGAMTPDPFPTIIDLGWEGFPANRLRPHEPAVGGRVWFVAVGGSDEAGGDQGAPLATIDRALELAQTGDVIQVADGEYPVGLYDDSLIMDTPGVTLMAENVGGAVLRPLDEDWAWLTAIDARADDLVIDGFVIRGFSRGYGVGFGRLESPQRNLVLRHLWIEGVEDAMRSVIPDSSPNPQPVVDGLLVYDVAIRDALIGFNCGEGPCNSVRLEALSIDLGADPVVDTGSWGDAVAVENGDNMLVFNADVTRAGADGLDFKVSRVVVANVIVHDVARNGIKLWQDGDVINALVYNTGADAAIVFDAGGDYRLLNCTIARHAYGDHAYGGTVAYDHPDDPGHLEILNSIFYQNSGALWVSGAFELNIRKTVFYGSADGREVIWDRPSTITVGAGANPLVTLESAGGGCCGLPFADPNFVDPDGGDYRLAPLAFARDRAFNRELETLPPFDLMGNPRMAGVRVDLGPYEMPVE